MAVGFGTCAVATRVFLFLLGAASLLYCVMLEHRQQMGNTPPETVLGLVASSIGLTTLLPGLASVYCFEDIPQSIIIGLDFVAFSLHLAAGVVLHDCLMDVGICASQDESATLARMSNSVLNGGCFFWNGNGWQQHEGCKWQDGDLDPSIRSCEIATAIFVLEFAAAAVVCIFMLFLDYLLWRTGGPHLHDWLSGAKRKIIEYYDYCTGSRTRELQHSNGRTA